LDLHIQTWLTFEHVAKFLVEFRLATSEDVVRKKAKKNASKI